MKHTGLFRFVFLLLAVCHAFAEAPAPPPFRLLFNAYDGNPKVDPVEKFEFQVNTIDLKQPSEFLRLGNKITKTPWKLTSFAYKAQKNPVSGESDDVSELTIAHVDTGQVVVLILDRVTDVNAPVPKK